MDQGLRLLEKKAHDDPQASWRFLQAATRSGNKLTIKTALHIAGPHYLNTNLIAFNDALLATGIPFNPLGISAESNLNSDYYPGYWWAALKERYSLEAETSMFNEPVCSLEERGTVPGFQINYGLGIDLRLYPDGRRTALVRDTAKAQKVAKWLGRGDPAEAYRLSQIYGYYGGDAMPESWVDQETYEQNLQQLRQRIVDAFYSADPDLEVRFSRGQGFENAAIVEPSQTLD